MVLFRAENTQRCSTKHSIIIGSTKYIKKRLNLLSLCAFVCIFLHCPGCSLAKHTPTPSVSSRQLTVVCDSHKGFRVYRKSKSLKKKSCKNRTEMSFHFALFCICSCHYGILVRLKGPMKCKKK